MSDEKKPDVKQVLLTVLETELVKLVIDFLKKKHVMDEVEHLVMQIYTQSKHYTLEHILAGVTPPTEGKTNDDA